MSNPEPEEDPFAEEELDKFAENLRQQALQRQAQRDEQARKQQRQEEVKRRIQQESDAVRRRRQQEILEEEQALEDIARNLNIQQGEDVDTRDFYNIIVDQQRFQPANVFQTPQGPIRLQGTSESDREEAEARLRDLQQLQVRQQQQLPRHTFSTPSGPVTLGRTTPTGPVRLIRPPVFQPPTINQSPQPQSSSASSSNMTTNEVTGGQVNATQQYDGSTEVELYIQHISRNQAQFGWDDTQTAAVVKNKLTKEAAAWLRSEELMLTNLTTWPHIRTGLRNRFKSQYSEIAAADMVRNLKQKEKETVNEFFDRVVMAVDMKNHTYSVAEKLEAEYKTHFLVDVYTFFSAGLKEDIRIKAMSGGTPPRTAADLRTAAANIEAQMNKEKPKVEVLEINHLVEQIEKIGVQEVAQVVQQLQDDPYYVETMKRKKFGRDKDSSNKGKTVTCYSCKKPGHYSYECRSGNSFNRGRSSSGRGFNRRGFGGQGRTRGNFGRFGRGKRAPYHEVEAGHREWDDRDEYYAESTYYNHLN